MDISSPIDIRILGPGGRAEAGALNLEAASLSAFGAESLLIGGKRSPGADGTVVTATTANITVDNAGSALTGPDVILVANQSITLAPSSVISQSGTLSGAADTLIIGNKDTAWQRQRRVDPRQRRSFRGRVTAFGRRREHRDGEHRRERHAERRERHARLDGGYLARSVSQFARPKPEPEQRAGEHHSRQHQLPAALPRPRLERGNPRQSQLDQFAFASELFL